MIASDLKVKCNCVFFHCVLIIAYLIQLKSPVISRCHDPILYVKMKSRNAFLLKWFDIKLVHVRRMPFSPAKGCRKGVSWKSPPCMTHLEKTWHHHWKRKMSIQCATEQSSLKMSLPWPASIQLLAVDHWPFMPWKVLIAKGAKNTRAWHNR